MRVTVVSLLLATLTCCHGYKILAFFPFPGKSHNLVWDPLLRELALRGHQVTALKVFPLDDPPSKNYKEIIIKDSLPDFIKMFNTGDSFTRPTFFDKITMILSFNSASLAVAEMWVKDPGTQQILNSNEKYDAVMFETATMQGMFTTLQHKFGAVGIEVLTIGNFHWAYWMFGSPIDQSYIVDSNIEYSDKMSFLERLHNTFSSTMARFIWYNFFTPKHQAFMDKHIRYPGWEERPPLTDMMANTSLVLINTDVALSYPHPLAPHFVQIGGINVKPNKPLPKDIQEFMDGAEHGIIFFTLGSHIKVSSTLGDSLRDAFSKVFSKLKQRVLWKWETDNFPNRPLNVKISKWFPQQDILAHKNIKLFISHGGLLSVTESVHYGVPVVGIPIIGDQDRNVNFIANKGMGIHLAFTNLTEESVHWAVNEIISHPRYTENAKKQSKILRDKPMTPLDKAVFWTEYAIRHKGAEHLKPMLALMPWYQQVQIDVYLAMVVIFLVPLYIIYLITRLMCRTICRLFKKDKHPNKKKQ